MKKKIIVTQGEKRVLSLEDMEAVNKIREEYAKEDWNDYAKMTARVASGENADFEILKCQPQIAKNYRADNRLTEYSDDLDIWIEIFAFNAYYGFYEVGIYLTDLWQVTGENDAEIKEHMYIAAYKREQAE